MALVDWLLAGVAVVCTANAAVVIARLHAARALRKARRAAMDAEQPRFAVDGSIVYRPTPRDRNALGMGERDRIVTVRSCIGVPGRPCGALVAGGPTRCGSCAHTAGEWAKGC